MIRINDRLQIEDDELSFTASRSSGPGGQHVNKTATQVTLSFDVDGSGSLTEQQKRTLRQRLGGRISREGVLKLTSGRRRSQHRNRQDAVERFVALLAAALAPVKPRRPTRPSRAARESRLRGKQHRAGLKKTRGRVEPD